MKRKVFPVFFLCWLFACKPAGAQHVILISIDGFRPVMYQDLSWPTPNLQQLMKRSVYADHMKSVFPAYTHPSHAAMTTGALPARSGIAYNQPKNSKGEWYWYYDSIKAPTIWKAIKDKGMTTAAVMWPNTVDGDITWNISEIWDKDHPLDRATVVRQHARPTGIYEELERNATGKLDSTSQNDQSMLLDENSGRMAAYIFKKYKPNFMAVHFACVDGMEHDYGRDHDSVRLAVQANDRAIGSILEAVKASGLQDSTTILIVGDHGFADYSQVFRANMLIRDLPVKFIAAGGSAFLYPTPGTEPAGVNNAIQQLKDRLDALPPSKRKLFRFVGKKELDEMGADSSAVFALAANAQSGLVFSGAVTAAKVTNNGPGTLIQQNPLEGVFIASKGGHHGYDPDQPDMWTGFIAAGAQINRGSIHELTVTDIAPLVMQLLHIPFHAPDGKLPAGVLTTNPK